jgi:hypothetical protein
MVCSQKESGLSESFVVACTYNLSRHLDPEPFPSAPRLNRACSLEQTECVPSANQNLTPLFLVSICS